MHTHAEKYILTKIDSKWLNKDKQGLYSCYCQGREGRDRIQDEAYFTEKCFT